MSGRTRLYASTIEGDVQRLISWLVKGERIEFDERYVRMAIIRDTERCLAVFNILENLGVISPTMEAGVANPRKFRKVKVKLSKLSTSIQKPEKIRPIFKKIMQLEGYDTPRQAALGWQIRPATLYKWVNPSYKFNGTSEKPFEPILAVCDKYKIPRQEFWKDISQSHSA